MTWQVPTFTDVLAARRQIRPYLHPTPLYSYPALSELVGVYDDLAWPGTQLLAKCINATFAADIPIEEWQEAFPKLSGRTVWQI